MADRRDDAASFYAALDPIIAEARERWARCDEAEQQQREAIREAKRFRAGDQWPEAIRIERQGGQAIQGQAAQPPKPLVTIDRISQPVRQVSNSIKQAQFAIDVVPNGHGADDDTAQIFKGYIRRITNLARDEAPVEWATDQAIEGGIGWFRIKTVHVREDLDLPEGEQPDLSFFDQEVRLARIANNLTVYCDPSSVKPTKSDALFMFVTEDLSRDEFRRRWPTAKEVGVEDFAATGNFKNWASEDTIRIAEYWRVVFEDSYLGLSKDGKVQTLKDAPDGKAFAQVRKVSIPHVECHKINAMEVLESHQWVGSKIPLIPVLGEELNADGRSIYRGMIASAMDPQRMVNYHYSGAIMAVANATLSPWLVAEGAIGQYKDQWQNANRFNYSYLPYISHDEMGREIPPPQRNTAETPIAAIVQLLMISEDAIKATMSFWDPSLGKSSGSQESGKKVLALQKQSDLATSNFSDNVMRALIYAGELLTEIIPKITRPGQLIQILRVDDEPDAILANHAFISKDGQPQPMGQPGQPPPPQPDPMTMTGQQFQQGEVEFYDLNKGRYAVTVTVGHAETTAREEGLTAVTQLMGSLPPEMSAAMAPKVVREMSFPGAQGLADVMEKALPPGLQPGNDGAANVQQLMAQNQQLQAALQQLQPLADKNQADIIKTREAKTLEGQKAQMQEDAETYRLQMKLAAQIEVARIQASKQSADLLAESAEERLALGMNILHESTQNQLDREHEAGLAAQQHQQALEQGAQQQQGALQQGAQQHASSMIQGDQANSNAMAQAAQQAELNPSQPTGNGASSV